MQCFQDGKHNQLSNFPLIELGSLRSAIKQVYPNDSYLSLSFKERTSVVIL